jgi:hypothetical protein
LSQQASTIKTGGRKVDTKQKAAMHAYLDADAHEAWHDFAATNGVSVSGLLQAIGSHLDGKPKSINLNTVVVDARIVDAKRRRRDSLRKEG